MKKIIKLKKIRKVKNSKKVFRKKKYNKKCSICKNIFYIGSPYNSNEYLINNGSSPFIIDEEDEDSMEIKGSSLICFNDENSELDLFKCKDVEMTKEKSALLSDKSDQRTIEITKVDKWRDDILWNFLEGAYFKDREEDFERKRFEIFRNMI